VETEKAPYSRLLVALVGVIAGVCLVWLIRAAAVVVIPLVTAFFVTIVVYPVQLWLHTRLPRFRWAALPLTLALLVAVLGGAVWAVAESIDEAVERAPVHADRVETAWNDMRQAAESFGLPIPQDVMSSTRVRDRLERLAGATIRGGWEAITGLALVFFLVVLMLIEAPIWNQNARRVLRNERAAAALETVAEIAGKIRLYLYVRTVLGMMSALAAAIWLLVLDVDLVLIWVVLTFLLNYIPNFGSIIAVVPPTLMALVQHGPVHALLTLGGLTVAEQIIGNFVEPRMEGRRLQISPVVVLVALIFWTWLWGAFGALLAVPMTVALIAAAARVPALQPLTTLLAAERERKGDDEDAAPRDRRSAVSNRQSARRLG
jgi:AI-2 transport protein TqsA